MLKKFITLFFCFLATFVNAVQVDMSNPNTVMHGVSSATLKRLEQEKAKLSAHPDYINDIVREELIPYFDYKYAAYKVLGSNLKGTTKAQRDEFVEVFKNHLIVAYGHVLSQFSNQKISIKDNNDYHGKKTVKISVTLTNQNKKITNLVFKFRKNNKTGKWKVFDVIAEGVSLLSTNQSEIGNIISKSSVNYVIKLLKKKNKE
ncbi:MAG: ABC transporter substrate-binding protein [Psychromonas sp.]|nr:ABC transporter substrate-binding protein [Psychromonas sp.]